MGEDKVTSFEPDFNRSVKIEFSDQRITSNAGVLLLREADSRLNLINSIAKSLIDTHNQDAIRYQLGELLRERINPMALGYSAQDDLDRLAHGPAFRIAVWNRSGDNVVNERLASQPTQSRLLSMMANHSTRVGKRMGNGFIHAVPRQGSVHTSKGATRFIGNVIERARQLAYVTDFRMDAGYTVGSVMDELTEKNMRFVGRLKTNAKLDELAAPYLVRPVGGPPSEGYEFCVELGMHQADSWKHPQRLILVVIDEPDPATGQLNLMPRYFFLVTYWNALDRSSEVLRV